jgi:two-component system sensor histidine kinase/response regulator
MAADATPLDREFREALVREARERIRVEGPVAELGHLAVAAVVVILCSGSAPRALLAGWVAVMVAATAYRYNVRHRIATRGYDNAARRAFQLTVGVVAVTWGVGAALFAQWLPFQDVALLLVILCGLVAAATSTLSADRIGFRIFLVGTMLPPAVGILAGELGRSRLISLLLIGTFAAAMFELHQRAHAALLERLRTHVRLTSSEARADWERAHLDALFASAPVAIVVVDDTGKIRDANPQFQSLFGYLAEEARGKALNDLVVPSGQLNQAERLDQTVLAGEKVVVEGERRRKDGQLVPVRASAARVEGAGAQGRELFVMYEDISDELRARRALEVAKDAAEHLAQMRSAFLANMSHEIRTPMNAILGLTELLLDGDLSAEQRRSLSLVQTSGEALLALLNDILDLSKIEAESLQLEVIPFDLWRVVDSTVALLAVRARERNIELLTDIPTSVPEQVRGDPTRLRQVLTNLIGNAVKFTHEGEVLVSISSTPAGDQSAKIRFTVRDTGIGIPAEQLSLIFQPFSQADLTMSRRYGGTGLGLTIAQRLVGMMGSRLEVASQVGKGSEFSFTIELPVETTVPRPLPTAGAVPLRGLTMLVVDDNQSNRRIVREMLGVAGVTVEEAADADQGLKALRRAVTAGMPYALTILDAQMPGRDGFELAEIVRNDPALQHTRLLMLTSAGQRGDAQRCRELGIRGYLTKPVSRNDLLDMVAGVLGTEGAEAAEVVTRHRIHESRRRLRILLAEDNPVNQEVAAAMLRKRGHIVDVVDDGLQAVEQAGREHYDVVLMDIQMPEMDGYEATEAIRAIPGGRDLPIVALTAHALADEREKALAHGMNAYLAKPFKAFELFAAAEGWGTRPSPAPGPPVELEAFRKDMAEAGAAEAVSGIIRSFVENAALRMKEIGAAVGSGDAKEVARLGHAFKSSAAQIGAKRMAELLAKLEQAAKQDPPDGLTALLELLLGEAEKVVEFLRRNGG